VKKAAGVALSALVITLAWPALPAAADGIRDQEWQLGFLHAGDAQQHTRGAGVIVAVVDSGIDATHVDLAQSVLPPVAVDGNTDTARFDPDGHGTALAGVIAGRGHNAGGTGVPDGEDGVLGIAPDAKVLPVVVRSGASPDASGRSIDADQLAAGIDLAVRQGATVICVGYSVAGDERLKASVAAAQQAGAIIVAADGNRPGEQPAPDPAGYDGVLAAVPLANDGSVTASSPSGRRLGLAVPGNAIMTTNHEGGYQIVAGYAAAGILAGAVALVRAAHPALPPDEVVHRLTTTATDLDQPGPDAETGYGRLSRP
jgi:subtilisin family serine protease